MLSVCLTVSYFEYLSACKILRDLRFILIFCTAVRSALTHSATVTTILYPMRIYLFPLSTSPLPFPALPCPAVQLANLDDSHIKAKRQFAADRKAAGACVTASLSDYFSCSTDLEGENAHTGPGSDHRINRRQSTRSVGSCDLHSGRSQSSKDDLLCCDAFCLGSSVEGPVSESNSISHSRYENALSAAGSTNKDSDVDIGGGGRRLFGGREGGGGEVGEENVLADVDGMKSEPICGASNRNADGVRIAEDMDTYFSFLTSSEGEAADTMERSSDDVGGGGGGGGGDEGESGCCTAEVGAIGPNHIVGEVVDPRSREEAGEKEVLVERSTANNTVPGTAEDEECCGGCRIDSTAVPEMAPLPFPPLPSPPLLLPLPQKAKKQTRFQLDDTERTMQVLSISAPLSVSSCMASPTGSPSPGGDRGDGWTEQDHALFTKVDQCTICSLFALALICNYSSLLVYD
jgi:hypothetical protein